MQQQAVIDDPVLQLGYPVLSHCRLGAGQRPLQNLPEAVVKKSARDRRLSPRISEFELSVLELEDWLTEGLTLFDVGNCLVQRDFKHGLALDGDHHALSRQFRHKLGKALSLLPPNPVFLRNPDVIQEKLGSAL